MVMIVFFVSLLVIWVGFSYLMIYPELVTLVPLLARLTPPSSWAELGNATSILNGLFSSIAILIGLMAICKQGRQIERSINEQRISNQLTAKIAYLEYLRGEMNRLEEDIQRLRRSEKYDKIFLTICQGRKANTWRLRNV